MPNVEHSRFQQERQTSASKDNKQIFDKESSKTTKCDYRSQITQYPTEDTIQALSSQKQKLSQTDYKSHLNIDSKITRLLEQEYQPEELEQHIRDEQKPANLAQLRRYRRSDSDNERENNSELKEEAPISKKISIIRVQIDRDKELFKAITELGEISEEDRIRDIKKYLNLGANIDAIDNNNNTVLHIAVEKNYKEIVKFLLEKGAKVNVKNSVGETPLSLAKTNQSLMQILIKSINVPGDGSGSCLFWAVTLAYLTPVKDNNDSFSERFKRLFGEDDAELSKIDIVRDFIQKYHPFSNNNDVSNSDIQQLVIQKFRNRVVYYMSDPNNRDKFEGFDDALRTEYISKMRNGGDHEIQAIALILNSKIKVYHDSENPQNFPLNDNFHSDTEMTLFHVSTSAINGNSANHFEFGVDLNIVDGYERPVFLNSMDGTSYDNLLDALDILRLEDILQNISELEPQDRIDPSVSLLHIMNMDEVDPKEILRSQYIIKFEIISRNVSLLSKRAEGIKTLFRNFPWDSLEKISQILVSTVKDGDISKFDEYKSLLNLDLIELKARIFLIITTVKLIRPEVQKLLDRKNSAISYKKNQVLKDKFSKLEPNTRKILEAKFSQLEIKAGKNSAFIEPEDTKPRGLKYIRQIAEPAEDQDNKAKLLKLIDKADLNLDEQRGRAALLGITFMVGEVAQNISEQTKKKNIASADKIQFKALKEFRDEIHEFLDNSENAKNLLTLLESTDQDAVEKFRKLKEFLTNTLKDKVTKLPIPTTINESEPLNSENPLPIVHYDQDRTKLAKNDIEKDIEKVLKIIEQALPTNARSSDAVKAKLKICNYLLRGALPLPIEIHKNKGLLKILYHIFSEELSTDATTFVVALNKNHDSVKNNRNKVSDDIKFLQDFANSFTLSTQNNKLYASVTFSSIQKSDDEIASLKSIKETILSPSSGGTTPPQTDREKSYVKKQLDLLLQSLELINQETNKIISESNRDYQTIRQLCRANDFHYFHLFHLIVIGQCIQNLRSKKPFINNASETLRTEFEFLKWVRNGLMHDEDINEGGSIFTYFNNDLLRQDIKEHGARTYDSNQYLQHLKFLIEEIKQKIDDGILFQEQKREERKFYHELVLKELKISHYYRKSEAETLIILALGRPLSSDSGAAHYEAAKILGQAYSLDLKLIFEKKTEILELTNKRGVTILNFGEKIVDGESVDEKLTDILVECSDDKNLALFKQEMTSLLSYRLKIATIEHLKEYYRSKKVNIEEAIKDYTIRVKDFEFNKIVNTIELIIAIKNKADTDSIKSLLSKNKGNFNLNIRYEGYTIAQIVAYCAHTQNRDILFLLISDYDIDVNVQDKLGNTLAHYAAQKDDTVLLKLLQSANADFSIKNSDLLTAFDFVSRYYSNNQEAYNFFVDLPNLPIEDKLVQSIMMKDIDKVRQFLENISTGILNKETKEGLIFNIACGVGDLSIIKLIRPKCDISLLDSAGQTALHVACYADNITEHSEFRQEVIEYLTGDDLKLDINAIDKNSKTALYEAIWSGNDSIIGLLLSKGADPNLGNNCLLSIINRNYINDEDLKIIKLLLDNNADILINDKYVGNSLHLAAERGHLKVVKLLVEHAQKIGKLTELLQPSPEECWVCKDLNALDIAKKYNHSEISKFLQKYYSDNYDNQAQRHNSQNRNTASTSNSQESRAKSLESLEEARNEAGLSRSNCAARSSSIKRRKRDICTEDEVDDLFPYDPLEETVEQSIETNARLYSNIAYLFSVQNLDDSSSNIRSENVINYNRNLGDIISEGQINHSKREEKLLKKHYEEATKFISRYNKDRLLNLVEEGVNLADSDWLFDNGRHSLLVSYEGNHYRIYSQDYNYRVVFQSKEEVSFSKIEEFARAFFRWRSGSSSEYKIFTLAKNLPQTVVEKLKQAKFWSPDEVASDLMLLNKGSFSHIENIPARVIRELFFLDGQVPEITTLNEDFFRQYLGRISLKVEEIHNVLPILVEQESKDLVNLINRYNFPIDKNYLNTLPESSREILHAYHNKVTDKLQQLSNTDPITIQDLSDLSWKIVEDKMQEDPDISPELKESAIKNVKDLHKSASNRMHALGVTTQTLFFLPDIIRSVNNDDYQQLAKLGGMIGGDMAFNKLYESLINKLEPVLASSRISLLKKLPITSPIFKVLTIHSIIELTNELNTLPADSERRSIIKHQLGEQYFTVGLMVAEMFGFELGPLCIGLMAEQLIYSAISLRKQYHLDISFGEALLLSLGFEKQKLQSMLEERGLVDINLSIINTLSNQTQTNYDFAIVKVPKVIDEVPKAENAVVEFKPYSHYSCMEDNVFLEESSGYKRVVSVVDNDSRNCAAKSPLRISGSGLAAFYSNKKLSNATRNIINIFDPNEGDLELKFTVEGLQELDRLNQLDQTSAYNKTAAYIVTTKILHKPYPDQIGLFGNKNHSLVLNDNSKRIISKYYIDGTIPFKLKDNIVSTSLMFLNNKVFNGYNAYISGDTQNIYVDSIYPGNRITGNIIFKDKNYLNLNLNSTLIKKLELNIPYVDLRYARGKSSREAGIIVVKPGLLVSNMSLGPNIRLLVDGSNEENNNRIIIRTHSISQSSLVLLQISLNEYKSYYSFSIDELQLILDDLNQMSRLFPRKFYFNCVQQPMSPRELCELSNSDISKNIILMIGKINDVDAKLTIEYQSSTLEALNGKVKHIEVMHYNNRVVLANNLLNFKKVVKPSEYNISHYHNNIVKHRSLPNWLMLKFSSNVQDDLLHHFKYDNVNNKVNINGINYLVQDNRIYAALDDEIDGSKLVRFDEKRTISVFVDRSLTNSTISTISTTSLQEKAVNINNATLYNLPDKTMIIFQESENKSLSVSFKLLLDSLVEKELPKQEVESVEFESTAQLKHVVSQQLKQLDSEIINGLKYLLANIGIKHNVKTYQCLGFYSLVAQKEFINAHNNDYNNQHLNQILSHDQVIETLIWLIAHSYSDYLSRNPNSKRSKLIKNIHQCFRFIVDKKIIHRLVKQLEKEDIEFRVKRFIKHHKQALKDRLEEKVQKYLGSEYLNVDASYSNSYSNNYQYSHHYIPQPEALISSATQQSSWMNDLINSGISKVKNLSTSLINRLFTDNASANNQSEHHSTFSQHHHSGYDQVPPNDNMTLLAMGDYYISRVDLNGTISLLDVIVRKLTGEKRSLFRDATISELEATNYAINITQELKKLVKQAAKDSFISEHRLNIDFIAMQEKITRKIMGGRFFEIEKILSSHIEQVCPSRKSGYSGRLSLKKFNKFMTIFYDKLEVILNQSMLQMLYSQDSMSMAYSKESNIIAEKRNLNIDSTDIEFIRVKTNNLHERPHNDLQPSLRGANLIPSTDIGSINAYFGEYTLNASENILELRVNDVGLKNVSIARNCVFEEHYNNLQRMIDDLIDTKSKIILAPVNLYNKHAVGIIALKNQDNELKLYYIDPSNEAMPDKLKQIFIDNSLQIEQLPVEQQKYANCGPEVVENFILYLTGERLLQEESIIYHSELVEQELVSKANNLTEIMSDCTNDQESVQDLHELNGQEEVELDSEDVVYIDIDEESDSSLEYPAPISRTTKDTKLLEKDKDLNNNNNSINDDLIREKKALFAYNQGNIFSNQAWEAENDENDDRSVEAAENFAKSLKFYQEAVKLSPNNIVYKHSLDITSLKIEGNSLFSEGVELANIAYELQEEANELVIDQEAYQEVLSHYQQAIGAYQLAKDSFFKGWLLSWDTRFESCIEIVENSIVSVQEAIEEIEEKIDGELIQKPTDITVADNYLVNDPIELFKQDDQPNLLNNYLAGNIVQEIYYM